jgi:hypothetical protein
MNLLLCSAVSKYLGHFPEGLVEFHILIDALDCPALGHPATIRAAAGTVTLTTANDVLLDTVQRDKKIFGSISITSWIKEHGGTYRGFRGVFPAISRRASRQSLAVRQLIGVLPHLRPSVAVQLHIFEAQPEQRHCSGYEDSFSTTLSDTADFRQLH